MLNHKFTVCYLLCKTCLCTRHEIARLLLHAHTCLARQMPTAREHAITQSCARNRLIECGSYIQSLTACCHVSWSFKRLLPSTEKVQPCCCATRSLQTRLSYSHLTAWGHAMCCWQKLYSSANCEPDCVNQACQEHTLDGS